MVSAEVTPEERQKMLLDLLQRGLSLTVSEAWEIGYHHGFYEGGEARKAKDDLNILCQRNQAHRHDGFWRHVHEPDRVRRRYKRWADYWTAR